MKAIAAMSLNRVIGNGNKLPWHLPEDFKWFKKMTTGQVIVMGRKTFESIGKVLPNRTTLVLTRSAPPVVGATMIPNLDDVKAHLARGDQRDVFICGGAQVYEHALPLCSDLYLTLVKKTVEGDAFFPRFEHLFALGEQILDTSEFTISHYVRHGPSSSRSPAAFP